MKYIYNIKLEHKTKWNKLRFFLPRKIMIRMETKKGVIRFARCPLNTYIETEKLRDIWFVYPWDVGTVRMVKLRDLPREGPRLRLKNGKLYVVTSPQINNNSLRIRYPRGRR